MGCGSKDNYQSLCGIILVCLIYLVPLGLPWSLLVLPGVSRHLGTDRTSEKGQLQCKMYNIITFSYKQKIPSNICLHVCMSEKFQGKHTVNTGCWEDRRKIINLMFINLILFPCIVSPIAMKTFLFLKQKLTNTWIRFYWTGYPSAPVPRCVVDKISPNHSIYHLQPK